MRALLALLLMIGSAQAADKAMILDDKDQQDLINALDAATRAQGLAIAPSTLKLLYKLQSAGTVTGQKEVKPDDKPPAAKEDKPQ